MSIDSRIENSGDIASQDVTGGCIASPDDDTSTALGEFLVDLSLGSTGENVDTGALVIHHKRDVRIAEAELAAADAARFSVPLGPDVHVEATGLDDEPIHNEGPTSPALGGIESIADKAVVAAEVKVGIPEPKDSSDDGADALSPKRYLGNGEDKNQDRTRGITIEGKVWPYGGERGETAEDGGTRLHTVALERARDPSAAKTAFNVGYDSTYYHIHSASSGVQEQQAQADAQSTPWDGTCNAVVIRVSDMLPNGKLLDQDERYYLFRPGQSDLEEDFRQMVLGAAEWIDRPDGWSEDPASWPSGRPVAIKANMDRVEVLTDPYSDPTLKAIGKRLEADRAEASALSVAKDAAARVLNSTYNADLQWGATTGSTYQYNELLLRESANPEAVRQDLQVAYQHHPSVFLIKNPLSPDPIKAIEAARAEVHAQLLESIGTADSRLPLSAIEDFRTQLGLRSATGLVVCNVLDNVGDSYETWPDYMAHYFRNTGHLGAFFPGGDLAVVETKRGLSDTALAQAVIHEQVGHGTEVHKMVFYNSDNGIYFWPTENRFNVTHEARATFLGANFTHLYMGQDGDGHILDIRGKIPMFASNKYARASSSELSLYGGAATLWELLIGKDQTIFEPFIAGDTTTLQQKVDAICPGLFARMEHVRSLGGLHGEMPALAGEVFKQYGVSRPTLDTLEDTQKVMSAVGHAHQTVVGLFQRKLR